MSKYKSIIRDRHEELVEFIGLDEVAYAFGQFPTATEPDWLSNKGEHQSSFKL